MTRVLPLAQTSHAHQFVVSKAHKYLTRDFGLADALCSDQVAHRLRAVRAVAISGPASASPLTGFHADRNFY